MAVTMAEITRLRKMTGAGIMDCKKALTEADNDFEKAKEILREKGKAIAAKRSEREAANGCVLAKKDGKYAALIALKCETDFVATNAGFVNATTEILDKAVANKSKSMDEVKALKLGEGTVEESVVQRSGVTGEKVELDGFGCVEGETTAIYIHPGNRLACIVAFNLPDVPAEITHEVAMQIAAMNPISIDAKGVPENVLAQEKEIAAQKAREEGKPDNLIERIAEGRVHKFYKEVCLLEQEYVKDTQLTIGQFIKQYNKDLTVVDFKRFTLNME
jgi:elongation factor Ts